MAQLVRRLRSDTRLFQRLRVRFPVWAKIVQRFFSPRFLTIDVNLAQNLDSFRRWSRVFLAAASTGPSQQCRVSVANPVTGGWSIAPTGIFRTCDLTWRRSGLSISGVSRQLSQRAAPEP